jgi:signal peptide peptidase SppA
MKTFYHKFTTEPFAMLPAAAAEWAARFEYAVPAGAQQDDERDFFGNTKPTMQWAGTVAIIPVCGPLIKGAGFLEKGFGAMAHSDISDNIAQALAANCTGIVLLVDSPGGTVRGTGELSDEIFNARQQTNVVAFTDGQAASAGFWLASSASAIYATPTAEVGAIGAILQAASISRLLDSAGIDISTFVSKGSDVKAAGNPYKAMTDGERAVLQQGVDKAGAMFTAAVNRNRPRHGGTQNGAMLFAADAKASGLIDGVVNNLSDVVATVSGDKTSNGPAAARHKSTVLRSEFATQKSYEAFMRASARGAVSLPADVKTRVASAPVAGTPAEQWAALPNSEKREFGNSFKAFSAFIRRGGESMVAKSNRASHYGTSANFKK